MGPRLHRRAAGPRSPGTETTGQDPPEKSAQMTVTEVEQWDTRLTDEVSDRRRWWVSSDWRHNDGLQRT